MKTGKVKELAIVNGSPVVVRIVDVIYDELASWPEHKLVKEIDWHQEMLQESKRLNDQFSGRA